MTIELTDATRAIFYVELPFGNWMATVIATPDGARIVARTRYVVDDKIHDSDDTRKWMEGDAETEVAAVAACREIVGRATQAFGLESWELLRGAGSLEDFTREFMALPFAHARFVSKEEYDSYK